MESFLNFKISHEDAKTYARSVLNKIPVGKIGERQNAIMRVLDAHSQMSEDCNKEKDGEGNDVSPWSRYKAFNQELKEFQSYVKEMENQLQNKMSHKDVTAYAKIAKKREVGNNWEEQLQLIQQVEDILTQNLDDRKKKHDKHVSLWSKFKIF